MTEDYRTTPMTAKKTAPRRDYLERPHSGVPPADFTRSIGPDH